MPRNTKKDRKTGLTGRCVPLSEDPDMIELKKLVAGLSPERREALNDYLREAIAGEEEGYEQADKRTED